MSSWRCFMEACSRLSSGVLRLGVSLADAPPVNKSPSSGVVSGRVPCGSCAKGWQAAPDFDSLA